MPITRLSVFRWNHSFRAGRKTASSYKSQIMYHIAKPSGPLAFHPADSPFVTQEGGCPDSSLSLHFCSFFLSFWEKISLSDNICQKGPSERDLCISRPAFARFPILSEPRTPCSGFARSPQLSELSFLSRLRNTVWNMPVPSRKGARAPLCARVPDFPMCSMMTLSRVAMFHLTVKAKIEYYASLSIRVSWREGRINLFPQK